MRLLRSALAVAAVSVSSAAAQMHQVKKPETVVRAVGVYEWTGPEAKPTGSRLVPVSIFINGELEDAGVYLAKPVPFALNTGTIFELESSGAPEGTLEIAYDRHLQSTGDTIYDDGWLGYGAFKPASKDTYVAGTQKGPLSPVLVNGKPVVGSAAAKSREPVDRSGAKRGNVSAPVNVDDDDSSEPVLVRKPVTPPAPVTSSPAAGGADTSVDANDKADRPTLKRRDPETTASGGGSSQKNRNRRQGDVASVQSVGSLNDDPDRPVLHRGAPPGQLDEDSLPPLVGLPRDMHQMIAVSDAKDRDEHEFVRHWESDAERLEILAKMQAAAKARLARYDALSGITRVAAAPTPPAAAKPKTKTTSTRQTAAKAAQFAAPTSQVLLGDEVLRGYTLSYGGADTFVYTASAPAQKGAVQYVTVVAQRERGSELKLALTSVTDSEHLDRTPWMRLVDAVDAEASNRASLLFELRAQHTRQFALYRVIGAQADQSLITGSNP